jgi:hypothetical protein
MATITETELSDISSAKASSAQYLGVSPKR